MTNENHAGARVRVDWRKVAFFASLCFALSVLENTIPKPIPFLRLGLANLPIMLSFSVMRKRESFMLILCKIFLQAIVQGTLFSYVFVFSFCGSLASGLCMMAAYYVFNNHGHPFVSLLGLSVFGALANNTVQLALARVFMFGNSVKYIAPVLLSVSLITSIILGSAALTFSEKSVWYTTFAKGSPAPFDNNIGNKPRLNALNLIVSITAFCVLIFFANIYTVYVIFFLFGILVSIKQRRLNPMPSALLIFFITLFSLFNPEGKIIFHLGGLYVTKDAALEGLLRGGRLRSFVSVSQFLMLENAAFPTRAGKFLSLCTNYFGRLTRVRLNIRDKKYLSQADKKLCDVWENADQAAATRARKPRKGKEPSAEQSAPVNGATE